MSVRPYREGMGRQRPAETVRYGCERRSFVVTVAVVGMESRFCVDRYAPRGKVVVGQRFEVARQVIIDEPFGFHGDAVVVRGEKERVVVEMFVADSYLGIEDDGVGG